MSDKTVTIRVRVAGEGIAGVWRTSVPSDWDRQQIEFHYNDGSWCANNLLDEKEHVVWDHVGAWSRLEAMEQQREEESGCLCDALRFEFLE